VAGLSKTGEVCCCRRCRCFEEHRVDFAAAHSAFIDHCTAAMATKSQSSKSLLQVTPKSLLQVTPKSLLQVTPPSHSQVTPKSLLQVTPKSLPSHSSPPSAAISFKDLELLDCVPRIAASCSAIPVRFLPMWDVRFASSLLVHLSIITRPSSSKTKLQPRTGPHRGSTNKGIVCRYMIMKAAHSCML
jgi:hypothetical protein